MLRRALRPVAAAVLRAIPRRAVSAVTVTRSVASKMRKPLAWTANVATGASVLYAAGVRQQDVHNNALIDAATERVHRADLATRSFVSEKRGADPPIKISEDILPIARDRQLSEPKNAKEWMLVELEHDTLRECANYFAITNAYEKSISRTGNVVCKFLQHIGLLTERRRDDEREAVSVIACAGLHYFLRVFGWVDGKYVDGAVELKNAIDSHLESSTVERGAKESDDDVKLRFEVAWSLCALAASRQFDAINVYIALWPWHRSSWIDARKVVDEETDFLWDNQLEVAWLRRTLDVIEELEAKNDEMTGMAAVVRERLLSAFTSAYL